MLRALRVPAFARLAVTYTLDELADWMAMIALAVVVYDRTGSALAPTALMVANRFAPGLVVPALAARLDRWPAGRLLAAVYALGAVALAGLAALTAAFWLPGVLALTFVVGVLAAVGRTVTRATTPAVLGPAGLLAEGNAVLNTGFAAMVATGPLLAGGLVAVFAPAPIVAIAAAIFLAQAVAIAPIAVEREPAEGGWRALAREGVAYVRSRPRLRLLLAGQFVLLLLLSMAVPVEVVLAKEDLGAGDVGYGALAASWGLGMLCGGPLFTRLRARPVLPVAAAMNGLQALGYLGMATAPTIALCCAAAFVGGVGNGAGWTALTTAVQEATDEAFQTRVSGLVEGLITLAPGVGFVLGGTIAAALSARATFALSGAGVLVVLALAWLVVRRTAPAPVVALAPEAPADADGEPLRDAA
jgi:hypothetical protein